MKKTPNVFFAITCMLELLKAHGCSVIDSFPPYKQVHGTVENKEENLERNTYYIWISSTKVQVDSFTFYTLTLGEPLSALHTRGNHAIKIDRLGSEHDLDKSVDYKYPNQT